MKVSPMPASGIPSMSPQGVTAPSNHPMQSIKMTTNATPDTYHPISPPIETPKEVEAVTQPLDAQVARIARQRRALQLKEKEILAKEQALLQAPKEGLIDKARLKSEPLNVLLENGVTYEQLTEAILANQSNQDIYKLKAEIETFKQGIDQKFVDREALAEKQVLAEMRREAHSLSRSDEYELVRETKSVPLVMQLIERTWKERKEVLDVPEALKLVEDELIKDAQRVAKSKKMQSFYPQATLQTQQRQTQGMRTLTNRDTASIPVSRKARALAAYYGTLKR